MEIQITTQCLTLKSILDSFNAPIGEEQAWAICYQCAKFLQKQWEEKPAECFGFYGVESVLLYRDGSVAANEADSGKSTKYQVYCYKE